MSYAGSCWSFSELDSNAGKGGNGIVTRVSLDLELREVKTGRLVWNQVLTHDDPVQAKKVSDVVESLDRNPAGGAWGTLLPRSDPLCGGASAEIVELDPGRGLNQVWQWALCLW